MTNEEAIKGLKKLRSFHNGSYGEHIDIAIKALKTQPTRVDETYLSIKDAIGELKAQREHIVGYMSVVGTTAYDMAVEALEAQPCIEDYPTCTECEHYDSEKHYCPRFCQVIKDTLAEAQPSEDCISRVEAIDKLTKLYNMVLDDINIRDIVGTLERLPFVIPQRPKGKWIEVLEHKDENSSTWHYECSECKGRSYKGFEPLEKYCPNCGAEMSGGEEDEVSD